MISTKLLKTVIICCSLIPCAGHASPEAPINWAETLRDALTLNNKPKSKDAVLQAQKELTQAAKDGILPTANLNYNYSNSSSAGQTNGFSNYSNPRSSGASASLSWTIFQCGANYYNYKAAQVNEQIMADQFESTQFFIPNTKGGVVASAFQAYKSLVQVNDELVVIPLLNEYLEDLKPIAAQDKDAATSLQIASQQIANMMNELQQSRSNALAVYRHWVTVDPGENINSLQQAIDELMIPADWHEAYRLAIKNSPDVRQASDQIRLAQFQIKAAQAALCPQIVASVGYGSSHQFDPSMGFNSTSRGPSYGIGFTIPLFNRPAKDNLRYQKKMLEADQLAQQAALDDAQFSLMQTYKDLVDQESNQRNLTAQVKQMVARVRNSEVDIKNGQNLPDPKVSNAVTSYINSKLGVVGNLAQIWVQLTNYKGEILGDKFSVLQAEGTIFNGDTTRDVDSQPDNKYNLP